MKKGLETLKMVHGIAVFPGVLWIVVVSFLFGFHARIEPLYEPPKK